MNQRFVVITVQYERSPDDGLSLGSIAPELMDAGLSLIDDRVDDAVASRTWAGLVEGPAFDRFAESWRLRDDTPEPDSLTSNGDQARAPRSYVFDGMNWETDGESPIICVTLQVLGANGGGAGAGRRSVEA